jgi:hypothetical protein
MQKMTPRQQSGGTREVLEDADNRFTGSKET